jgi:hypothetical protein
MNLPFFFISLLILSSHLRLGLSNELLPEAYFYSLSPILLCSFCTDTSHASLLLMQWCNFYRRCISFRVTYKSGGSPSFDSPLALITCIASTAHIWSPPCPRTTEQHLSPSWLLRNTLHASAEAVTKWYSGISVSRLSGLTSVFKTNVD